MNQLANGNLFDNIPEHIEKEIFETLIEQPELSIQRILTQGQTTDWLKENTNEWAILLKGKAKLLFEEGNRKISMQPGDYIHIPAGCRHKVSWTDPKHKSVWLTVHYKNGKKEENYLNFFKPSSTKRCDK